MPAAPHHGNHIPGGFLLLNHHDYAPVVSTGSLSPLFAAPAAARVARIEVEINHPRIQIHQSIFTQPEP